MTAPSSSTVSLSSFQSVLARYDRVLDVVSQAKTSKSSTNGQKSLVELDKWKDDLRATVIQRRGETDGDDAPGGYMTKDEVLDILRWKLKHGKNRPTLPSLVDSNSGHLTKTTTLDAFSISPDDVKSSLTKLIALRGIGPATATAILSTIHPDTVPFFSDEAFRWVVHDSDWNKKIDYTMKEYLMFYDKVKEIVHRLEDEISAKDVERVGWILGQEHTLGLKHGHDDDELQSHVEDNIASDHEVLNRMGANMSNTKTEKDDKPELTSMRKSGNDASKKKQIDVRRSKRLKTGPT